MADISDQNIPGHVTTGPIRGSRKIYVEGKKGVRVAMREIDLEPSANEPPVRDLILIPILKSTLPLV